MDVYEVANVEEAIDLAVKMKEQGKYDWFRGQVHDWAPISSLRRVFESKSKETEQKVYRRYELFFTWVKSRPNLRHLLEPQHVHDAFAILQHYGIPTHYIDFTTNPAVAGFFAADTRETTPEGRACIYCLDTKELEGVWNTIKDAEERKGAEIELVRIDVTNLWRLQAQEGVFVYANYNWQIDFPTDRILFPYSGYPPYPTRERIYPKDKSPLEQELDQYLMLENATFSNEWLREQMRKVGGGYYTWEQFPDGYYEEAFPDKERMKPLKSWDAKTLAAWEIAVVEDYQSTVGTSVKLNLRPDAGPGELRQLVTFGMKQILRLDRSIRGKAVRWEFAEVPQCVTSDALSELLRPVWNGMRRLPYRDDEIAETFGIAAQLLAAGAGKGVESEVDQKLFEEIFGEAMKVGFSFQDGSGTVGFASKKSLYQSLREDLRELLSPEFQEYAEDLDKLFGVIYNPKVMFEFDEFKLMFGREVIPTQAVMGSSPMVFNPATLKVFGNP